MKIQFVVDKAFYDKFGGSTQAEVDKIMVHAQTFFNHESLTTTIEMDYSLPYIILSDRVLTATGNNLV